MYLPNKYHRQIYLSDLYHRQMYLPKQISQTDVSLRHISQTDITHRCISHIDISLISSSVRSHKERQMLVIDDLATYVGTIWCAHGYTWPVVPHMYTWSYMGSCATHVHLVIHGQLCHTCILGHTWPVVPHLYTWKAMSHGGDSDTFVFVRIPGVWPSACGMSYW